ncbi:DUF4270 domain-containing protein [Bacteroidota bacterium]|nr:DUF4270 domain-containing protein [Bacteroidota bacterium]
MRLYSYKSLILFCVLSFLLFSCKEPSEIGLDIHPESDRIIIKNNSNFFNFSINTISEDSLRTDEPVRLLLGNLTSDPVFPKSNAHFISNLLLPSNNISFGDITNIIVDSVILQYVIDDYYGNEIQNFPNLYVSKLTEPIYKDSLYYSNYPVVYSQSELVSVNNIVVQDSNSISIIKISIDNSIGQEIIDGGNALSSNEDFLQYFYGLKVTTVNPSDLNSANDNTILYLNADNQKSKFSIYYRDISVNDSVMSFDLMLGGDAARVNLFNQKNIQQLNASTDSCYVQSMSSYITSFQLNNLESIKDTLNNKVINKVNLKFSCNEDLQFGAHEKLFLVRKNSMGVDVFLSDFVIEGESHFGGQNQSNNFTFNITRYFSDLVNETSGFTDELLLLPSGAVINANRTIIPKSSFLIEVIYSEL